VCVCVCVYIYIYIYTLQLCVSEWLPLQTEQSGGHLLKNSVPRRQTVPRGNLET